MDSRSSAEDSRERVHSSSHLLGRSTWISCQVLLLLLLVAVLPASANYYGPGGPQNRGGNKLPPTLPILSDRQSQLQRAAAAAVIRQKQEQQQQQDVKNQLVLAAAAAAVAASSKSRDGYSSCKTSKGNLGKCKPLALCPGHSIKEAATNKCVLERSKDDSKALYGICCNPDEKRKKSSPQKTNRKLGRKDPGGGSDEEGGVGQRRHVGPKGQRMLDGDDGGGGGGGDDNRGSVQSRSGQLVDLNKIIANLGDTQTKVDAIMRRVDEAQDIMRSSSPRSLRRDPESLHNIFNAPDIGSKDINHKAEKLIRQTEIIQETNNLTAHTAGVGLKKVNAQSTSLLKTECPWIPAPLCNPMAKYRTINGSCNNLNQPNYGMARTPYQRMVLPKYAQGTIHLPRESATGGALPSARLLSKRVTWPTAPLSTEYNTMMMQFGQFVAHDVAFTPNHNGAKCCRGRRFPTKVNNDVCIPIKIPEDDPFWGPKNRQCLGLTRSIASPGLLCELEFRQQMNQVTHWLDLSLIYGSSEYLAQSLREHRGGLLLTQRIGTHTRNVLPICGEERVSDKKLATCSAGPTCRECFLSGDTRTNEQYLLTTYHTIFLREHNYIATQLSRLNPTWDDEKLYQEARRINVAQYQHVTYNEYLPSVLGKDMISAFSLGVHSEGQHSSWYSPDTDARIPNEFAAAAFRFGHSTIPSHFVRGRNHTQRLTQDSIISLRTTFFNPAFVQKETNLINDLVRGGLNQPSFQPDGFFVLDVLDHLFEQRGRSGGLDLLATNIMRGRDHGLPGYNTYREACNVGTGRANSFEEFTDVMRPDDVQKLKQFYKHYDDVDLYVGGLMEIALNDSLLGPTFICIIGDTFARLRCGDRFFYDLGVDPVVQFSQVQLREIRKISLARILCHVFDELRQVQPQAMHIPGFDVNRPVDCNSRSVPEVDLRIFSG